MTQLQQPIKFAYWVPNVSGGLVVSNIEQRTDWSYDYNVRLAQAAENMVLNMRSPKFVLRQGTGQKTSMSL